MAIFIQKGLTVGIREGGFTISIDDQGRVSTNLALALRFDVCPAWIGLALEHLADAEVRRTERDRAWAGTSDDEKSAALEKEFQASMQAMVAAATALDAFYAIVRDHISFTKDVIERWRQGRTPRYVQLTEVFRQAFKLHPKSIPGLKKNIKEIYHWRDAAVHPSGNIQDAVTHPELGIGVEWRFAIFSAANAKTIVNATGQIIWQLAFDGTPKDQRLGSYLDTLRPKLKALFPNGCPKPERT